MNYRDDCRWCRWHDCPYHEPLIKGDQELPRKDDPFWRRQ